MSIDKFFKTDTIDVNGQKVEVRSITAKQHQEFSDFNKENEDGVMRNMAWLTKYGCAEFHDCSIDELMEMPTGALAEIGEAVMVVSGMKKKANAGAS